MQPHTEHCDSTTRHLPARATRPHPHVMYNDSLMQLQFSLPRETTVSLRARFNANPTHSHHPAPHAVTSSAPAPTLSVMCAAQANTPNSARREPPAVSSMALA